MAPEGFCEDVGRFLVGRYVGDDDCSLFLPVRGIVMTQIYDFSPLCRSRAVCDVYGRLVVNPQGCRLGRLHVNLFEHASDPGCLLGGRCGPYVLRLAFGQGSYVLLEGSPAYRCYVLDVEGP